MLVLFDNHRVIFFLKVNNEIYNVYINFSNYVVVKYCTVIFNCTYGSGGQQSTPASKTQPINADLFCKLYLLYYIPLVLNIFGFVIGDFLQKRDIVSVYSIFVPKVPYEF